MKSARTAVWVVLFASLPSSPAAADELDVMPAVSAGFSYPQVFSVGAGVIFPLARREKGDASPSVPGIRADVDVGLGGGSIAVGVYVPVRYFAFSLKAVRMRTWLLTWHEEPDRTFDGGVVEFAIPSLHGGPKVGIGAFKDTEPLNGRRDTFTYVFLGVGW